jgi:tRNA(adenine34) deaminase
MMDFASETERWMRRALLEAEAAAAEGEVPVGCVVVHEGRLIGRGHNRVESLQDPTAHAEILALTAAAATLGSWRLPGAKAYVTVEPCVMCIGALHLARIETVFFGPHEPKFGACGSVVDIPRLGGLNHRVRIVGGILEDECAALLKDFFRKRRRAGLTIDPDQAVSPFRDILSAEDDLPT